MAFGCFVVSASASKGQEKNKTPVGLKLNKIINDHLHAFTKHMNRQIKSGPSEKDLKRFSEEDKRIYKAMLIGLKRHKAHFTVKDKKVILRTIDQQSVITLVDYLNQKYEVDGKLYTFDPKKSFKANLISAGNLLHKRSVFQKLLLIEDAHALLPLLAIPGWAWLSAAGATGVSFFADTAVSAGMNDISNSHPKMRLKIQELTRVYAERANTCEADLAQARVSTGSSLTGNNTIRMVGALIEGLGAELEDSWLDGDGKEEIDYSKFGCEAYNGVEGISNDQMIGLWGNINPHGQVLRGLCENQDRLNKCFASTEEVMRENDVRVNDLSGPDRIGPYDGLVDDYRELQNATSR